MNRRIEKKQPGAQVDSHEAQCRLTDRSEQSGRFLNSKSGRARRRRALMCEALERRQMLSAEFAGALSFGGGIESSLDRDSGNGVLVGPAEYLGEIRSIPLPPIDQVDVFRQRLREGGYDYSPRSGNNGSSPFAIGSLALEDTFFLHSRPGASKTIFLDFDGFTATGTTWNVSYNRDPIVSPPYDPAGDGPAFNNAELRAIQQIWHRVAEDFAPFEVNVTTEDPGEAALVNTGGADSEWGMRVVITIDDWANCGCGGFAYIDSFNWNYNSAGATDTPTYVFNVVPSEVTLAISHEVGHTLGLSHDGTTAANPVQPNAEYYFGHGLGETAWGPIMGAPYYTNVVTWDRGEYIGASNGGSNANYDRGPDDLSMITTYNGFGYRPDDHGDVQAAATELVYLGANPVDPTLVEVAHFGIIERSDDADFFSFVTGEGTVNINIQSYAGQAWIPDGNGGYVSVIEETRFSENWGDVNSSNLDVLARLYDFSGNLIATSNPTGLNAAFTNLDLAGGAYFISIEGAGFGNPTDTTSPTGYTRYGSLGQYHISGTIVETGGPIASAVDLDLYYRVSDPLTLTVTYTDRSGVDVSTLDTGDIRVVGPNGYDEIATFVSVNINSNGTPRVATYTVPPPSGGAWDSSTNGIYTIKLEADEVRDVDGFYGEPANIGIINVDIAPTLGPDGGGYYAAAMVYEFDDIRLTGTRVLGGADDNAILLEPGNGFLFEFYGQQWDSLFISSNGLITFGEAESSYFNSSLAESPLVPAIAVLWDDLIASASEGVYWQVKGSGDQQRLILQWETSYFGSTAGISFQAVLSETDNSIVVAYRDLDGNSSLHNGGASATVGIKDGGSQGASRLLISFNEVASDYVGTGRAIRFEQRNQAPSELGFATQGIFENLPADSHVGDFWTVDPDVVDSHTYELVAGTGDDDNDLFYIDGTSLMSMQSFDFEDRSSYSIRVRSTDSQGLLIEQTFMVEVLDLPEVNTIVVGDGSDQRSNVKQVVVTFDGEVTIDDGAFEIVKRGDAGGAVPTNVATTVDSEGRTVATITFAGPFTRGASLVDGSYQLMIHADLIRRGLNALDGDVNGTAGGDRSFGTTAADKFYAFFGDVNGDGAVSLPEFNLMRSTFGKSEGQAGYNELFDFDGNGVVGLADFNQFRSRFGRTFTWE